MLLSLLRREPLSHFHRLVSLFSAWMEANDIPANLHSDSSATGPEAGVADGDFFGKGVTVGDLLQGLQDLPVLREETGKSKS